jgi:D-alanyl-D-alanine carboxypeptidase
LPRRPQLMREPLGTYYEFRERSNCNALRWERVKIMRHAIILLVGAMLASTAPRAPGASSTVDVEELVTTTASFLEELNDYEELSLALMITKDGVPVLENAYGLANRSFDIPNRMDTKFNLASMNKMFTAVAIMQLVQKGELDLDDKIGDHIPDYPNEEVKNSVTVYQLLTHTAGLGNIFGARYGQTPVNKYQSVDDYLPLFVGDSLRFAPGSKYEYSNAGYILLGYLIEKISGKDYYSYVKENIFAPAGMKDTDNYDVQYPIPNLAIGYSRSASRSKEYEYKTTEYMKMTKGGPAGGGYTTVGDLIRFGDAVFGNVLLDKLHTEMLTTGKVTVDDLPEGGKYCFGLVEQYINGHRVVGHIGNLSGIRAALKVYVDDGVSIAILSNFDRDQGAEELEYFLMERIAGETEFTQAILKNYEMVRIALRDGYEAAVRRYKALPGDTQLSEGFMSRRGNLLLRSGRYDRAITLFRFSVFVFPNSSNANASLAGANMEAGDNQNAIKYYKRALEFDPESESAIRALKKLGVAE